MQYRHYYSNKKDKSSIPLVPCSRDAWNKKGYADTYDRLNLTRWLCPQ